jgi:hypothetical protein
MDGIANFDVLQTLLVLLPGFLTAEIVGALVLREERSAFDRVVQAMIYTFLSHLLWTLISLLPFDSATPGVNLFGLGICAVFWGLLQTYVVNSGILHDQFRKWGLTQATSRPNEWYDAFYRREWYVILHLKDGRRIFGWPLLYSQRPDKGHIFLTGAVWLDSPNEATPSQEVNFLISVTDVRFVEFVPPKTLEMEYE